jgi:hypothetical protein
MKPSGFPKLGVALCRLVLLAGVGGAATGAGFRFQGQASAWALGSVDSTFFGQAGLRYIPTVTGKAPLSRNWTMDAEASANAWTTAKVWPKDSVKIEAALKPYRLWVRVGEPRLEVRLGLQKINFGSATLLRPLMWFDRIDPRDPLQMTGGVYGLLGRYYFGKGGNVWAWGLLGNDEPKGWEYFPTERWKPEFGGRVQVSVPRGEVGATCHHRSADWGFFFEDRAEPGEDRLGLDGRWDIGPGIWFEGTTLRTTWWSFRRQEYYSKWQQALTLGVDYTLPFGNGLSFVVEHMLSDETYRLPKFRDPLNLTALSLGYTLGLLDNLRGLIYYDWRNQGLYRFLSWQRTLDNWTFNVAAFWNPGRTSGIGSIAGSTPLAGKGIQVMVVLNH